MKKLFTLLTLELTSALAVAQDLYPVSAAPGARITHASRYASGIGLSGQALAVPQGLRGLLFHDLTARSFSAQPGETLRPTFQWNGTWMSGYIYLDLGRDGQFAYTVNTDGTPAEGSDLMAYSYYQGRNSAGQAVPNGNVLTPPAFTLPADLPYGAYRLRYKVDWDNIDPAGSTAQGNEILTNGGLITDTRLVVHGPTVKVTGNVLEEPLEVPYGQEVRIPFSVPKSKVISRLAVKHGYGLDGDSLVGGTAQYVTTLLPTYNLSAEGIVLPAGLVDGDLRIEATLADEAYAQLQQESLPGASFAPLTLTGLRPRTYTVPDATMALHDLTDQTPLPVRQGGTVEAPEGVALLVDMNRDGLFSLATERTSTVPADLPRGVYRALCQTAGGHRLLLLLNVVPERVGLSCLSTDGRIIGRQTYATETLSRESGVPAEVLPYKFLGLTAQPLRQGYTATEVVVRHGHGLDGDPLLQGIPQWTEYTLPLPENGNISLPLDSVNGDIRIRVDFTLTGETPWALAFSDDFEDEAIRSDRWRTSTRHENVTWARFISDDPRAAFLQDGHLVCRTLKNDNLAADPAAMLSGAKETRGLFSFTHGYVEVRAKTLPHTGNFPAIWLMPDDQSLGWPSCGEIDIWETIDAQNRAWHTVHSHWTWDLKRTGNPPSGGNVACTQDGEWHTYGLLKQDGLLTWYIDGKEVFSYARSTNPDHLAEGQWPFEKAFYLILNQSVGNNSWAAYPDPNFVYETRFDWVRVYTPNSPDGIATPPSTPEPAGEALVYDIQGRPVAAASDWARLRPGLYIIGKQKVMKQ